jgi:hypothetical protein
MIGQTMRPLYILVERTSQVDRGDTCAQLLHKCQMPE